MLLHEVCVENYHDYSHWKILGVWYFNCLLKYIKTILCIGCLWVQLLYLGFGIFTVWLCLAGWFCFTSTEGCKPLNSFILIQRSSAHIHCLQLTLQGRGNERQAYPHISNPAGMTGSGWIAECHLRSLATNLPNATLGAYCGRHFVDGGAVPKTASLVPNLYHEDSDLKWKVRDHVCCFLCIFGAYCHTVSGG